MFVNEEVAGKLLGIKTPTLRLWRHQKKGPPARRFSRCVRYYVPDLASYAGVPVDDLKREAERLVAGAEADAKAAA